MSEVMELHELIQKVTSYTGLQAEPTLHTAYQIAADAHKGFMRLTKEPYISHPLAVADLLADWHAPTAVVAAGLLHDILSPEYAHGYSLPSVQPMLESAVFRLLEDISYLNSFIRRYEADFNRGVDYDRDINANLLLYEVASFVQEQDAFIIKIADRLHNARTISALSHEHQKRMAHILLHIFAPLADRLGMGKVKQELEAICFKIINPIFYDFLEHHSADITLNEAIKEVLNELGNVLAPLQFKTDVYWQPFSLFSMYHHHIEKNVRHGKLIHEGPLSLQLEECGSFIILTDEDIDCYTLLGIIHMLYRTVEREFHEYISNPRENGYRSLHTQVTFSNGHLINVVIRTRTMNLLAEYGYTASWQGLSEELLPRLPVATRHSENEIQVFTPTGEPRYLPRGATPIDFAYNIHTDMGDQCLGAIVNGKRVDLYRPLQNADTVEIIRDEQAQPSLEWLKHVVTHHASNRIRHWLTQQNRKAMEEHGRTLLNKELLPLELSSTNSEVLHLLTHLAQIENLEGPEDILVAIGVGRWRVSKVVERLKLMRSAHFIEPTLNIKVLDPEVAALPRDFARCCHPTPPNPIIGYRRNDRVLIIHKSTCPRIRRIKKPIEVQWEITAAEPDYLIVVEAVNRAGLVADLSHVIATLGVDMLRFDSHKRSDGGMLETWIYLGPTTSLQRSSIQAALEAVPYVKSVEPIHTSELPPVYIPNPYGPSPAVGPRFYGRQNETEAIISQLRDQTQNSVILLCGQKRIGKTSLVLHLEEHARGDFHPVYVDVEGLAYCTTTQFLHRLTQDIFQQLKVSIPDSAHTITVPHFNHFKTNPLGFFNTFLTRIQDALQYQPVALILDEFQYLCNLDEEAVSRTEVFINLCSLAEHGHSFHILLSGSGLLSKFIEQPGLASLLSSCYEERLGSLGEAAVSRLIKEGLSQISEVEEEAVSLLYNITAGHPYYLQLLCYKLHEQAQEDGMAITHTFTSQIIDEWLRQADESRFLHLWSGNDSAEALRNKVILSAIAHLSSENHEVAYGHLCEVLCPLIPEKDLMQSLEDLVYMNVLKHDQLNYAIEVDLLALWLRRHWPLPFTLKEAGLL